MEISEAEYKELKDCRQMLGVVGTYLEDFCNDEETVLQGLLRLLAEYYTMKSNEMYEKLDSLQEE